MEILRNETVSLFTCIPHIGLENFVAGILTTLIIALIPVKSITYSAAAGIIKEERIDS